MEPLSPNDPIHKLLGKVRPVEPRPNFTQNVLRAIRQTPQTVSAWERVKEWLGGWGMPRVAVAGAMAALAVGVAFMAVQKPAPQTPMVAQKPRAVAPPAGQPALHEVSAAMILAATAPEAVEPAPSSVELDPMGVLLVEQDTSALTNSDLALLAY